MATYSLKDTHTHKQRANDSVMTPAYIYGAIPNYTDKSKGLY